jgi:hypothetical protein
LTRILPNVCGILINYQSFLRIPGPNPTGRFFSCAKKTAMVAAEILAGKARVETDPGQSDQKIPVRFD